MTGVPGVLGGVDTLLTALASRGAPVTRGEGALFPLFIMSDDLLLCSSLNSPEHATPFVACRARWWGSVIIIGNQQATSRDREWLLDRFGDFLNNVAQTTSFSASKDTPGYAVIYCDNAP